MKINIGYSPLSGITTLYGINYHFTFKKLVIAKFSLRHTFKFVRYMVVLLCFQKQNVKMSNTARKLFITIVRGGKFSGL